MKQYKIKSPPLTALMQELKQKMVREEDIILQDVTEELYEDIGSRLRFFQPINIQVRGEVSTSKSTVSSTLMWHINRRIQKILKTGHYDEKIKEIESTAKSVGPPEDLNKLIYSDQTEFLRFVTSMMSFVCIQIDEYSRFGSTGYSATTEEATFAYYSDTFAQMFVHRILSCPAMIMDVNSYLVLDVIGTDLEQKGTKVKVTYRDITDGSMVTLGYAIIDVEEVMGEEWYKRYRQKKFRRFQLLGKHGKRDVRELEFDHIAFKVFSQLQEGASIDRVTTDEIEGELDIIKREEGRVYSMLADQYIARKVRTLLGLVTQIAKSRKKYETMYVKAKGREKMPERLKGQRMITENKVKRFERLFREVKKMSDLYTEFLNIE